MRRWPFLLAIVFCAAAVHFAIWSEMGRPVELVQQWHGKVASMSFAPFRRGQSPLTKVYPTPAQIAEDVERVAGSANSIRTYTSREGMNVVPELARKHGLSLTHSAWLGREPPYDPADEGINPAEISALIEAAKTYPDVIKRVIVGNEVLLRKDLPVEKLIEYIRQVKAAVNQPVSYADVWAFYMKYPQVADEVDFITIHILPYWEDEPHGVVDAEAHLLKIVKLIKQRFPGKPILIGEAGWPTNGRSRGPAVPSIPNAAEYVRILAAVSQREGFDYNVVEAFDQPWKSRLEGTVGANWGVISIDREVKYGLSGPVLPLPDWLARGIVGVVLGSLAGLFFGRLQHASGKVLGTVLLAQVLGGLVSQTGFETFARSYFTWQDLWSALKLAVAAFYAWVILRAAVNLPATRLTRTLPILVAVVAIVWAGLLAFDGRYRDIPVSDFLVPAYGVLMLQIVSGRRGLGELLGTGNVAAKPARRIGNFLLIGAVASLVGEGFAIVGDDFVQDHTELWDQARLVLAAMVSNTEMLVWAAMLVIMAAPFLYDALKARAR